MPFGYSWKQALVGVFVTWVVFAGVMTGFTGSSGGESVEPTSTPSEPTQQSLEGALNDSVTSSHAESVSKTAVVTDTDVSYVEMHFAVGELSGVAPEQEAVMPVKQALITLNERDAYERVDEYRFFVYADTADGGESVLLKVVIDADTASQTNWQQTPWQDLREKADQYKYNG